MTPRAAVHTATCDLTCSLCGRLIPAGLHFGALVGRPMHPRCYRRATTGTSKHAPLCWCRACNPEGYAKTVTP